MTTETSDKRVYILARKILKNNTRIFKQAESLTNVGYDVTIIGIWLDGLPTHEERDGYKIVRLQLNPLHNRWLKAIRHRPIAIERSVMRAFRRTGDLITLKALRSKWGVTDNLKTSSSYDETKAKSKWWKSPLIIAFAPFAFGARLVTSFLSILFGLPSKAYISARLRILKIESSIQVTRESSDGFALMFLYILIQILRLQVRMVRLGIRAKGKLTLIILRQARRGVRLSIRVRHRSLALLKRQKRRSITSFRRRIGASARLFIRTKRKITRFIWSRSLKPTIKAFRSISRILLRRANALKRFLRRIGVLMPLVRAWRTVQRFGLRQERRTARMTRRWYNNLRRLIIRMRIPRSIVRTWQNAGRSLSRQQGRLARFSQRQTNSARRFFVRLGILNPVNRGFRKGGRFGVRLERRLGRLVTRQLNSARRFMIRTGFIKPVKGQIRGGKRYAFGVRSNLARMFIRSYNSFKRFLVRNIKKSNTLIYGWSRSILLVFRWPFVSLDYYHKSYQYVRHELPHPHVVQANDLDTLLVSSMLAKRSGAQLIYDSQELYTGIHTFPGWYRKILAVQEFFLIRRANKTIAVNDAIGDVMSKNYRVKIDTIILNCPPYEEKDPNANGLSIREKFGIGDDVPIYLYSGGLVKLRGIENTVMSLKYLEEGLLVILGEGQLKDELITLIKKENLSDRVFFSDFVPHKEVPRFISSADVGIIPYENVGINHYLCSPSKLFHYIMAELPIACSNFPFLRKVVVDSSIGAVFDPSSPESIANAITDVVADSRNGNKMKENLVFAKKRYCWEEEEKKFLAIYDEISNSRYAVRSN